MSDDAVTILMSEAEKLETLSVKKYDNAIANADEDREEEKDKINVLKRAARLVCNHPLEVTSRGERVERGNCRELESYVVVTCSSCKVHLRDE